MKTLRSHGFNQRPRCPWTSRTARPPRSSRATSTWTISYSPARTPTRSLCSTRAIPEEGFRTPAEATDEDLIHLIAYQLVTLSGTGVSVLD